MAYTNSPLVSYTRLSPNHSGQRNHAIDTITIHCVVGQCTVESLGAVFAPAKRKGSSNYGVGRDGKIGMYVEEKNRSWCSSSPVNDHRAITIEVASDTTDPYAVKDAAYNSLIKLVADICKRNGIKKLVWSNDKNTRINHLNGCNMTVHRDFAATACPGRYLYEHMPDIAAKANRILDAVAGMPPAPSQPSAPSGTIGVGSKVEIKAGAEKYNPASSAIPGWVKSDYYHIVTQTAANGKEVVKGGKKCVLLGKKVRKKGGSEEPGINTWVALDNLTLVGSATPPETYRIHTVVHGDTLWAIAQKYLGSGGRYPEIKALNGMTSNNIYSGMKLKIPN